MLISSSHLFFFSLKKSWQNQIISGLFLAVIAHCSFHPALLSLCVKNIETIFNSSLSLSLSKSSMLFFCKLNSSSLLYLLYQFRNWYSLPLLLLALIINHSSSIYYRTSRPEALSNCLITSTSLLPFQPYSPPPYLFSLFKIVVHLYCDKCTCITHAL